jgi:hypothetical protein
MELISFNGQKVDEIRGGAFWCGYACCQFYTISFLIVMKFARAGQKLEAPSRVTNAG